VAIILENFQKNSLDHVAFFFFFSYIAKWRIFATKFLKILSESTSVFFWGWGGQFCAVTKVANDSHQDLAKFG
jgi:hypothetical protein